jgi:hypothetical protein
MVAAAGRIPLAVWTGGWVGPLAALLTAWLFWSARQPSRTASAE